MTRDSQDPAALAQQALGVYQKGQYDQAIELFKAAQEAYTVVGNPSKAAEMANNLSVALVQSGRHMAALEALEGSFNVFIEQGDMTSAAQALGNEAAAYEGLQNWEKAEALYQQAADRFAQMSDAENQRYTLQALSRVRLRQGHAIEAVSTMRGALETGAKNNWRTRLVRKLLSLPSRFLRP
ncbi:MAG: tetratricopeptide repeat protein [Anaerolineales bacterium]|nr:MAG: tetratricopeptide repeat protein [Anaerolineales bacterium]